ncbi:hypothetical protein HDN1F_37870 [gamma proteobacterium HdN1]|nr:hypothetical protein HDN1F_37870 [gamma proteobacterium HdN1]
MQSGNDDCGLQWLVDLYDVVFWAPVVLEVNFKAVEFVGWQVAPVAAHERYVPIKLYAMRAAGIAACNLRYGRGLAA